MTTQGLPYDNISCLRITLLCPTMARFGTDMKVYGSRQTLRGHMHEDPALPNSRVALSKTEIDIILSRDG